MNEKIDAKTEQSTFLEYNDKLKKEIADNSLNLRKNLTDVDKKIKGFSKLIEEMKSKIANKIGRTELEALSNNLSQFSKIQDLQILQDKLEPQLNSCTKQIESITSIVDENKAGMVIFEQTLLDKANRLDLTEINRKISECITQLTFEEVKYSTEKRLNVLEITKENSTKEIEKIIINTSSFNESLREILLNQENLKQEISVLPSIDEFEEMKITLKHKADKFNLSQLYDIKTNKTDTENIIKSIDVLHKQLK